MAQLTFKAGAIQIERDITGRNLLHVLKEILPKHKLPEGFTYNDLIVIIDGNQVNLESFCINRQFYTDVSIMVAPKGIDPISVAVAVVIAVVASVVLAPDIPTTDTGSNDSPNNSFFGQTNQIRLGELEPNLYGKNISYPDLVVTEGGSWEYVNNQKIIKELFLIGTGAYDKEEPKYEFTPLTSILGSSYTYYEPFSTIPVVQGQFNSEFIDGQVLLGPNNDEVVEGVTATQDPTLGGPVSITGDNFDAAVTQGASNWDDLYNIYLSGPLYVRFEYDVYISSGGGSPTCDLTRVQAEGLVTNFQTGVGGSYLIRIQSDDLTINTCIEPPTTGEGYGTFIEVTELVGAAISVVMPIPKPEVQVSFDFRGGLRGTVDIDVYITEGINTSPTRFSYSYTADTADQKFFSEKISIVTPVFVPLTVTLIRTNNDKDDNTDRVQISQLATNSYRNNAKYGNNTMLATNRKATEQAIKTRESKINLECTRKTISYNLNTGQIIPTLNASRSFADAILHEYTQVRGLDANDLPLDEMYTIYDSIPLGLGYFDSTFADKQQSVKDALETIANVARCVFPWDGDRYSIYRNEPRFPVIQFDSRNIDFNSPEEVSYRGASATSNNGVRLKWKNPDGNKFDDVYYVIQSGVSVKCVDNGGGSFTPPIPTIPYEVDLVGCSTLSQANDRADLECRTLIFIQKTLKITTLVDGENVSRGQVVKHVDYFDEEISSGEISAINGTTFTSHNELNALPGNYYITYTDQIGSVYGPVTCEVLDDTHFIAIMPEAYLADGYLIQSGTRFAITTLVEHSRGLYVVSDKSSDASGSVSLELVEYNESIYP